MVLSARCNTLRAFSESAKHTPASNTASNAAGVAAAGHSHRAVWRRREFNWAATATTRRQTTCSCKATRQRSATTAQRHRACPCPGAAAAVDLNAANAPLCGDNNAVRGDLGCFCYKTTSISASMVRKHGAESYSLAAPAHTAADLG